MLELVISAFVYKASMEPGVVSVTLEAATLPMLCQEESSWLSVGDLEMDAIAGLACQFSCCPLGEINI